MQPCKEIPLSGLYVMTGYVQGDPYISVLLAGRGAFCPGSDSLF